MILLLRHCLNLAELRKELEARRFTLILFYQLQFFCIAGPGDLFLFQDVDLAACHDFLY